MSTIVFATLDVPGNNPNGIASFSPGLRGTRYPGFTEQKMFPTLKGLNQIIGNPDATPLGLWEILTIQPRVGAHRANPGLNDGIPLGFTGRRASWSSSTDVEA